MASKWTATLAAGAIVVVLPLTPLLPQQTTSKPDILAGIREVQLGIAARGEQCLKSGLDTGRVRVESEVALRRMGVRVVQQSTVEFKVVVGCIVSVDVEKDTVSVAFVVEGEVREWVSPTRSSGKPHYLATTWSESFLGYFGYRTFREKIFETIRELFLRFENDWLAANPPR